MIVAANSLLQEPALWAAAIMAVPSAWAAYAVHRRGRRVDAVAEKAGIASSKHDSIGQVVAGQDTLIENLQEDNRSLREHVRDLTTRLNHIIAECEELKRQVALLSA